MYGSWHQGSSRKVILEVVQESRSRLGKDSGSKYFPGVEYKDIPRLALEGKVSFVWDTLKRGAPLIKEGLF